MRSPGYEELDRQAELACHERNEFGAGTRASFILTKRRWGHANSISQLLFRLACELAALGQSCGVECSCYLRWRP